MSTPGHIETERIGVLKDPTSSNTVKQNELKAKFQLFGHCLCLHDQVMTSSNGNDISPCL